MSTGLEGICRTCLGVNIPTISILEERYSDVNPEGLLASIADILDFISSTKISESDGLPKQVCLPCAKEIYRSYCFKVKRDSAEHMLQEYVQKSHNGRAGNETGNGGGSTVLRDITNTQIPVVQDNQSSNNFLDESSGYAANYGEYEQPEAPLQDECDVLMEPLEWADDTTILTRTNDSHVTLEELQQLIDSTMDTTNSTKDAPELSPGEDKEQNICPEAPFQCHVCSAVFSSQDNFVLHLSQHETIFENANGSMEYRKNYDLSDHMKQERSEPRNLSSIRGEECHSPSAVTSHLQTQKNRRSFLCSVCGKCFKYRSAWQHHLAKHQKTQSFRCEQCGKAFSTKVELNVHGREHAGDQFYLCSTCGYANDTNIEYMRHLVAHTPAQHADECPNTAL